MKGIQCAEGANIDHVQQKNTGEEHKKPIRGKGKQMRRKPIEVTKWVTQCQMRYKSAFTSTKDLSA